MRPGTLIAAALLITAAILFAPRAGRDHHPPAPAPTPPPAGTPDIPPEPTDDRPAGRLDSTSLFDGLPCDDLLDTYPDDAWRKLCELRDRRRRWVTPEEFELAARWRLAALSHADRLRTERTYREAWQIRTNMRLHPYYSERQFVTASRPPWLVYVEKGEGAQACADRSADLLRKLSDEVHRLFGERFELPRIVDCPHQGERVLLVVVLKDKRAFLEHFRRVGQPKPSNVQSVYLSHPGGCILHREKGLSETEWGERLFYPAVHQVLHVLTKARTESDDPERGELSWRSRGMDSKLLWFREGLVRMLSHNAVGTDGKVEFGRLDRGGLGTWRETRQDDLTEWKLAMLLEIPDERTLRRKAMEIGLHPAEASRLQFLFRIQAWAFFHFLWHHENRTYREKLLAYLEREFHGKTGYRVWRRVWGTAGHDGAELEKEFEAWLQKTFAEEGIK